MRRLYLTLALASLAFLPLSAQLGQVRRGIAVGANAGLAMNKVGFNPTIKQWWHMGPQVGITARFTSELYFKTLCSLQVELNYARTGWREHILSADGDELPDTYSRDHNYLQLPILAHLAWGREGRGLAGFLLAGPQLGFLLGEKSRFGDVWTVGASGNPSRPNGMFAQYSMDADHRFDYGITAGAGLELQTAAGRFIVEGRYYYGLADIYKNSKKDVFGRSNNGTIYAKVTYLFDLKRGK